MKWPDIRRRAVLRLTAGLVLAGGLGSAAVLYRAAPRAQRNENVEAIRHTKRYVHDLQVYGGGMALIEDDIRHWFDGVREGAALPAAVA